MRFDWTILADNIDLLARGALNTFLVLLLSLFFGSIIGALVCAGNLQTRRLMRLPSRRLRPCVSDRPGNGPHLLDST